MNKEMEKRSEREHQKRRGMGERWGEKREKGESKRDRRGRRGRERREKKKRDHTTILSSCAIGAYLLTNRLLCLGGS